MPPRFPSHVVLRSVSRAFGRTFALHRVDLDLHAGSVVGIVGDNGAGKSTLLELLATTDQPTSGAIEYDDMARRDFARRARHRIGWVSHHNLVYDELTARENLLFFARMYGIDDAVDRVDSWLERVGLADDANRRVRTFSRGMTQRLTIARALLHNPQLLLFDEPATGLDQQGSRFIVDLLRSLRDRRRIVVLVTHDFDLLDGLADRLVILRRGQVTYDHPIEDGAQIVDSYRTHA